MSWADGAANYITPEQRRRHSQTRSQIFSSMGHPEFVPRPLHQLRAARAGQNLNVKMDELARAVWWWHTSSIWLSKSVLKSLNSNQDHETAPPSLRRG